ncbi:MAG: hypothetical protein GX351_03415, partial [Peptococcaceae bacterium]|nr:hypothetical protein [Peptococcaceae bacterium]
MSLYEKIKDKIYSNLQQAAIKAQVSGEINFAELPSFVLEEPREKQ